MPAGTPDWLVAEGSGTPDATIVSGSLLTDSEHASLDHDGLPGIRSTSTAALTDNSGGTADGTIDAIASVGTAALLADAADCDDVNAQIVVLNDNLADLAAKINQLITDLT